VNTKGNGSRVTAVIAVIVTVLALGAVLLATQQKAALAPVARSTTTYNVTNGQATFNINGTVYTTTNGQVSLTDADYAYYKPMIDAGILTYADAPAGNTVFMNTSVFRVAGGTFDLQAGSVVSLEAPIATGVSIAGAVVHTDTTALVGATTATGAVALNGGATVGGGFGSTGCTLSTAGVVQCNGAMAIGGAATITGAVTSPGGFIGALTGNASGTNATYTTLTVTNLISQVTGVSGATANITDVTGINATFTTVTATLVGNARGTSANYTTLTGTLGTAAQPNITGVGPLATATITYLTATTITGTLIGNVTGDVTGTLAGNASGINASYTTITGTLATPTQTNITSIGTLVTAIINNLTSTKITGTLMTPAQTNVTSIGVLNSLHTIGALLANSLTVTTTASIADLSVTNPATITLATANQPNVTNLGTQAYLTATNFSVANIHPSGAGSAANVNYCMSADCDTGLYYPGDNNIGLATGGVVRAQVSNTGLDVTPTLSIGGVAFSGASKWGYSASQANLSTITHGLGVTPTACIVTPKTATISATVEAIGTTVFTVSVGATGPVFWMCGQ